MKLAIKLLKDTLTNSKGIYSRKSVTTLTAFSSAIVYEFILPWFGFQTKEYVFVTLMGLVTALLGLSVWDKKSTNSENAI